MYRERKPLFPKLHRCGWCKRKLNREMPIIAKETFWGDGISVDAYYCDKNCAKAEYIYEENKLKAIDKLNEQIKNHES